MSIRVKIDSRDLQKKLGRLPGGARSASIRELHDAAVELRDESRLLAPKDTLDLERSIVAAPVRVSGDVIETEYGTDNDHASFQEFGWEDNQGQPFIRPAVDGIGRSVAQDAARGIKRDIEGV